MRTLSSVLCLFVLFSASFHLGSAALAAAPIKDNSHIGANPGTPDGREGGETVDDAIDIPALPFEDTGNTSDNIDDYDEVCPYTGSLSPDVVYVLTPEEDITVDIDLCESEYDTKLYIYEGKVTPGAPYACNDDFDCATAYRSGLYDLPMESGNSYYIVIDGYGSDMGTYILEIHEAAGPPCKCGLDCPDGAVAEGEPEIVDEYIDQFNGGCDATDDAFQVLEYPSFCALSGWYLSSSGSEERDTDWYSCVSDNDDYTAVTMFSEFEMELHIMLPTDCASVESAYEAICYEDEPGVIEFAHPAGNEFWMLCRPTATGGPVNEFRYTIFMQGIVMEQLPVTETSWGDLKTLFGN
jgi:hypothetical protein